MILFHSFIVETHTIVNVKEKSVMEAEKMQALKELTFLKNLFLIGG